MRSAKSPFGATLALKHGGPKFDAIRKQVNAFIRSAGVFDSVADMARATEDPATGALYTDFQSGDYIHPNRAGHQAMAAAIDINAIAPKVDRHVSP
jgi:lysophospholipase L1-like esterase